MPDITQIQVGSTTYDIRDTNALAGAVYNAILSANGWTKSGSYYTQTVSVSGLQATYAVPPIVDCVLSGSDAAADTAILTAFGQVVIVDTAANAITAKAIDAAPDVNVPIVISVWG